MTWSEKSRIAARAARERNAQNWITPPPESSAAYDAKKLQRAIDKTAVAHSIPQPPKESRR